MQLLKSEVSFSMIDKSENKKQERAPEMHSTKKGNIYYFTNFVQ